MSNVEIIRPKITGRGRFSRLFTGENVYREKKLRKHSRPMLTRRWRENCADEGASHSEWKFSMNFYNAKPDNRRRNGTRFEAHLLYKIIFDAASKRKYEKISPPIWKIPPYFDSLLHIDQLEIFPWI